MCSSDLVWLWPPKCVSVSLAGGLWIANGAGIVLLPQLRPFPAVTAGPFTNLTSSPRPRVCGSAFLRNSEPTWEAVGLSLPLPWPGIPLLPRGSYRVLLALPSLLLTKPQPLSSLLENRSFGSPVLGWTAGSATFFLHPSRRGTARPVGHSTRLVGCLCLSLREGSNWSCTSFWAFTSSRQTRKDTMGC